MTGEFNTNLTDTNVATYHIIYVVDFYCSEAKVVIELDGSQHYEDEEIARDMQRTMRIEQWGLKVIRIPNNEVNQNFDGVCEYIHSVVSDVLGYDPLKSVI